MNLVCVEHRATKRTYLFIQIYLIVSLIKAAAELNTLYGAKWC
jgi:hypothetical protein